MPLGFSVKIFVPAGDPEGLRVVEMSGWNGKGLVFPRSLLSDVKKRPELQQAGVYVLWEVRSIGLIRAYIGEGTQLLPRLESHAKGKEFWTHAVAFTSKDQSLNKAHVQHLEARLVELASQSKRCTLQNANVPKEAALSEADRADAELFLAEMRHCLPIIGVNFFENRPFEDHPGMDDQDLFLSSKKLSSTARGQVVSGGFVVRAGSLACKSETKSIGSSLSDLRKSLVGEGVFQDAGAEYRLVQDHVFSSSSNAGAVLLGMRVSGPATWKDKQGRTLKEIQESQAETV